MDGPIPAEDETPEPEEKLPPGPAARKLARRKKQWFTRPITRLRFSGIDHTATSTHAKKARAQEKQANRKRRSARKAQA